ncbi:MAG: heavy-metal-associated domain-containing protein [Paludibacteraceae bacterium]|nr:heavy-metal-associated domain-containing protein [Paludibacteraceae bacterium]
MKRRLVLLVAALGCALTISAKDIRTVTCTTDPQMHCAGCENKIKENLRFEKGVKAIETSVEKQTVKVTYDADKTNEENIIKGFAKIKYTATILPEQKDDEEKESEKKK